MRPCACAGSATNPAGTPRRRRGDHTDPAHRRSRHAGLPRAAVLRDQSFDPAVGAEHDAPALKDKVGNREDFGVIVHDEREPAERRMRPGARSTPRNRSFRHPVQRPLAQIQTFAGQPSPWGAAKNVMHPRGHASGGLFDARPGRVIYADLPAHSRRDRIPAAGYGIRHDTEQLVLNGSLPRKQ